MYIHDAQGCGNLRHFRNSVLVDVLVVGFCLFVVCFWQLFTSSSQERISLEKVSLSDWSVENSVRHFLD